MLSLHAFENMASDNLKEYVLIPITEAQHGSVFW